MGDYYVSCSDCCGTGKTSRGKTCPTCEGFGKIQIYEECFYCSGTGEVDCGCTGGEIEWADDDCPACGGSGTLTCPECGGTGMIRI